MADSFIPREAGLDTVLRSTFPDKRACQHDRLAVFSFFLERLVGTLWLSMCRLKSFPSLTCSSTSHTGNGTPGRQAIGGGVAFFPNKKCCMNQFAYGFLLIYAPGCDNMSTIVRKNRMKTLTNTLKTTPSPQMIGWERRCRKGRWGVIFSPAMRTKHPGYRPRCVSLALPRLKSTPFASRLLRSLSVGCFRPRRLHSWLIQFPLALLSPCRSRE